MQEIFEYNAILGRRTRDMAGMKSKLFPGVILNWIFLHQVFLKTNKRSLYLGLTTDISFKKIPIMLKQKKLK